MKYCTTKSQHYFNNMGYNCNLKVKTRLKINEFMGARQKNLRMFCQNVSSRNRLTKSTQYAPDNTIALLISRCKQTQDKPAVSGLHI